MAEMGIRSQVGVAAMDNPRSSLQRHQPRYDQKHWIDSHGQGQGHGDSAARDDGSSQSHGGRDSGLPFPDTFYPTYHDPLFDDYIAESWLPQAAPAWSHPVANNIPWSHSGLEENTMLSRQYERQQQPAMIYTNFGTPYAMSGLQSPPISAGYELTTANNEPNAYRSSVQTNNQIHQNDGSIYQSQTPQASYHQQTPISPVDGMSCFQLQTTSYLDSNNYGGELMQEQHISTWSTATENIPPQRASTFANERYPISPESSSPGPQFGWTIQQSETPEPPFSSRSPPLLPGESAFTISIPIPKRKVKNGPEIKSRISDTAQKDLSDCVDVFENEPGALKNVKRRKKLDAPVRKAAREVRKAGACHQCKFRKRTCSTGTPCGSCLKNGGGLHELKCQRESPFIGKQMHQYFQHSSQRRIVNFSVKIPLSCFEGIVPEMVTVDGIGRISHPLVLPARTKPLSAFNMDIQESIRLTENLDIDSSGTEDPKILILEEDKSLGTKVEQWAVEYTSKFVHAAGPKFYATTMAHILGTSYVKKGLPESDLVAAMLRVASVSFVLRAGIKSSYPTGRFRTIQAKIDTILFERLALAQKDLFQKLQRLIFRSAGCLNREQVYPVGLVLFQLLRFLCISASHLSNIAQRFRSKASEPADYQHHSLRLVLSVHMALFRSSNPLLLDLSDHFNQDMVGGDKHLIQLATQMREVVVTMKDKGFPELKGSITYKKGYFDQWRRLYDSK